jgi:hypothetical protein
MASATIKLFLPLGDAKSLRTAEISNWTGKAVAAPRTELDELLAREELDKAGVYILLGTDPLTNAPPHGSGRNVRSLVRNPGRRSLDHETIDPST